MPRFTSSAILRATNRVYCLDCGYDDCIHALQSSLRYSRPFIPCAYCICMAQSGEASPYLSVNFVCTHLELTLFLSGDGQLPEKSATFMIGFSLLFAVLSATKTFTARRQHWLANWIPSGVAFAIGFLNTPSFSIARLIGGVMEYVYRTRYARDKSDIRLIVIASGFVLGEGVVSIVTLVLQTFGVHAASCWGCVRGLCGSCSP